MPASVAEIAYHLSLRDSLGSVHKLEIEHGVPIKPDGRDRRTPFEYDFERLEIGDSFWLHESKIKRVELAKLLEEFSLATGREFEMRRQAKDWSKGEGNGTRVWRIK